MGRLVIYGTIALIVVGLALYAFYKALKRRETASKPERDISTTPGLWYTYTRTVGAGDQALTEYGIQYVADRDKCILERRMLGGVDPLDHNYATLLDQAQDEAYAAQRVANLGLVRR